MAQIDKPVLTTERLVLRSARPEDVADRLALGNSPAIQKMFGMDPSQVRPLTLAAAEAWVDAQAREPWGWVVEHEGKCIGSIRLHTLNWADKRASLALGLLDEEWLGIGLGSEAMAAVIRFALGPLGLHRLSVRALAFNERAIAAYEKVGFKREGIEREAALIGSEWHDDVLLGLIAKDVAKPRVQMFRIRTARLELRPLQKADEPRVVDMLNDLRISEWLAQIKHPFTMEDVRIVDENGLPLWPRNMGIIRDGTLIGTVGTIPHLGYYLAPEAWGQGFMTEAVSAALAHVFMVQERDEITSGYFPGNEASRKILEAHGFTQTGTSKITSQATGIVHDHADMVLTRAAWEAACSP